MNKMIVVAGATGNLGERITRALLEKGAEVRVIVREGTDNRKINHLEELGAKVFKVDMNSVDAVAAS